MKCKCGGPYKVIASDDIENGVRRRRQCLRCKDRVWTVEIVEGLECREMKVGRLVVTLIQALKNV